MHDYFVALLCVIMVWCLCTYAVKVWYKATKKLLYMNGLDLAVFAFVEARRHKLLALSHEERAEAVSFLRARLTPLMKKMALRDLIGTRFVFSPGAQMSVFSPSTENDILLSAMLAENCGFPILTEALTKARNRQ